MGNLRVGEPVLTTHLRGDVAVHRDACAPSSTRSTRALFGGAAPDAMMALARLLSTLVDDEGNVAVAGVTTGTWEGAEFSEEDLRSSADLPRRRLRRGLRSDRVATLGQTRRSTRSAST